MITKAHLSDLIRAMLLSRYGGIWIDACVFVLRPIEPTVGSSFYSINLGRYSNGPEKLGRWVIGMMGCSQSYHAMLFLSECLNMYWKSHNTIIAYLLTDYLLCYYYENNVNFRNDVDMLTVTSPDFPRSRYAFNKPVDEMNLTNYMKKNHFLSFSWRINYHSDIFETYYDRMISIIRNTSK